jgi:hypothetical protein
MVIYQEKIPPPAPLPFNSESSDVLPLRRAMRSLERGTAWLREVLARIRRDR